MRIFAAGIATETNTFSPMLTSREVFLIQRGSAPIAHPTLDLRATWGEQANRRGDTLIFSLMAWAQPSGVTLRSAYESLRDEVLNDLRAAMPVDIVLLNLHGAMVAQGYDDCEADLIRRVREIVGKESVIGVELDLHCHLSQAKIAPADIVITYKEYPHTDRFDRARELFDLAAAARCGQIKPRMALFDCRMVGLYPTSRQPLRGFVDEMMEVEHRDGVLSVSFGHGFQFADVPNVGAKMLIVADADEILAQSLARELGMRVYRLRHEIGFDSLSLPLDDALARALAAQSFPVVVADQSDNAGAGAPGDATFALRWLLDHGASEVAMAIFYDPEAVRLASKAGEGATLPIRLGGKLGLSSGDPVDLEATVLATRARYAHAFPQQSGRTVFYTLGDVVALRCRGIDIVVSSERSQCFSPSVFSDLGIDPHRKRLLVVKSAQHFHSAFGEIASDVIYMSAPGAVAPDPRQIRYRRFNCDGMYPWIDDPLVTHP
jgi:microcystin degradation protein MlrC